MYVAGPAFLTADPVVARWLHDGLDLLIAERRRNGHPIPPELMLKIQIQLHDVATETTKETISRHEPRPPVSQKDRPVYLSTYDAAKRLSMTPQGVTKACRSGRLTFIRNGKSYEIDARSVAAFLAEKEQSA